MKTLRSGFMVLALITNFALAAGLSPLFQVGKLSRHSFSGQAAGYGALGEDQSHVAVYVSPKDAGLIHPGMTAEVRLGPPEGLAVSVAGEVSAVLPDADPRTRQAIVSIHIPDQSLSPRTYANALIQTRLRQALAVPSTAVLIRGGKAYVYKKVAEAEFEKTAVVLGEQGPDYTEIRSGLRESDEILIQGALEWAARETAKGGE